jgi:hypothetical protein
VFRRPYLLPSVLLLALTIVFTWPQARYLGSRFASHNDPNFSIWRIAWIAHALGNDPRHLFDANIFHPHPRTLAYSDATLLEGLVAAPLLWAGTPPVAVYNLLLLGGIFASGLGMFVLARHLTDSAGAALSAAAVFMMVPYRIEHYGHLELQWAMWIPLAFWAVHRTVDEQSWRAGLLTGLFLWLQVLSCAYYGVFLAIMLGVLAVVLLVVDPRRTSAALPPLALGALLAAALTYPYTAVYAGNVAIVGSRDLEEIVRYSAQPTDYLAAPSQNWWWSWTGARWGSSELRLFPGGIAVCLALTAFARRPVRLAWAYAAAGAVAFELSLGARGRVYAWLLDRVDVLHGLRAPGRMSIVAFCALAVLAGLGVAAIEKWTGSRRGARFAAGAAVVLLTLEYASAPMVLTAAADRPLDVYKVMHSIGPGVVAELPMPTTDRLPGKDAVYAYWSIAYWHPLVNGYSGYYPPDYFRLLARMQTFPDERSIATLAALDVRYVVVHRAYYAPEEYRSLMARIAERAELRSAGRYRDPLGDADLFELKPQLATSR